MRLSAPAVLQGNLLRLDIGSAEPLSGAEGKWNDHSIPVWQDSVQKTHWHALVGVDLETPPGAHDLTLMAAFPDGAQAKCTASIPIRAGKFEIEKLQVAEQFVKPSPEEEARAEKEGQRLHDIYATITPERLWTGAFRVPLVGERNAKNFGRRRVLNGEPRSPHTGVDMPAPTGTPVHASQRGRVVLADNLFYAGNAIVIDHGLGVYTFYCHLSQINVKEGDTVERGALIGKVGATGRVTGPHLHWGLTIDTARVNPLQIAGVLLDH